MFISLIYQRENIVHLFDNCEQLRFNYENMINNSFVLYINQSLMKRFLKLNYSYAFLNEQQHKILLLNNSIFKTFYYKKIQLSRSADTNRSKIII